jgi:hypothetical protein
MAEACFSFNIRGREGGVKGEERASKYALKENQKLLDSAHQYYLLRTECTF